LRFPGLYAGRSQSKAFSHLSPTTPREKRARRPIAVASPQRPGSEGASLQRGVEGPDVLVAANKQARIATGLSSLRTVFGCDRNRMSMSPMPPMPPPPPGIDGLSSFAGERPRLEFRDC